MRCSTRDNTPRPLRLSYAGQCLRVRGSQLAVRAGAAFVKTGTGWAPTGATLHNVQLIKSAVGEAARVIAAGKTRLMDVGSVNGLYFDNNSAMGLEPSVTLIQQKITFIHGTPRYLLATLIAILQNPHWTVHLEWEGGAFDGPVSLVTVGNNPLTGGLFYMTPHADPSDGKLTFVYGYMRTRLEVLRLSGYAESEKVEIARRYLIPRQVGETGLPENSFHLPDETVRRLVARYTREAGVRNLDRQIAIEQERAGVSDTNHYAYPTFASDLKHMLGHG